MPFEAHWHNATHEGISGEEREGEREKERERRRRVGGGGGGDSVA